MACEVAESRLLERFEEEWRGITPDDLVLGDDGGGESGEGESGGARQHQHDDRGRGWIPRPQQRHSSGSSGSSSSSSSSGGSGGGGGGPPAADG